MSIAVPSFPVGRLGEHRCQCAVEALNHVCGWYAVVLTLWKPSNISTSFMSPDRNAWPWSDRTSAGTPCLLTISSTSSLAIVAADWSCTANIKHSVQVSIMGARKLDNIHANVVKGSGYRNRGQGRMCMTTNLVGSSSKVSSAEVFPEYDGS